MANENKTYNLELAGLAAYLFRDGLLTMSTAKSVGEAAQQQEMSLTNYLVKSNILSSQSIFECCVRHFKLPIFDLKNYDVMLLREPIIKPELIWRYRIIPIRRDLNNLYLGVTDPTDHTTLAALSFHTGLHIHPLLVAEEELDKLINTHCRTHKLNAHLETALSKMQPLEEQMPQSTGINQKSDEPVIEFVNQLIQDAINRQTSDIHIEPYEQSCRIRFRRDGLLYEVATIPSTFAVQVATRLKIMGFLNIAERRLPQDGRIQYKHKIDIRINTCPTLFGEKIVLRILDKQRINLDIAMLGMTETQQKLFFAKLSQSQGLILVSGPTGSGKTVTLYSALNYLNQIEKNIITVEDPVEIELNGINQVNVNSKIGLSFSAILRNFLRQDPDVIMVGEIRDRDTAEIAIQAAQTGHLVLSTLHTNSAAETISRLQGMGVAPYHLMTSVSLIVAQRLLRKLCNHCKQPDTTSHERTLYNHAGCAYCHAGYAGRIGIFELLPMNEDRIRTSLPGINTPDILDQVKKAGHVLLSEAGLEKVWSGVTSQAELSRIVGK